MEISAVLTFGVIFLFMMYGVGFIKDALSIESTLFASLMNGLAAGITVYFILRTKLLKTRELPIPVGMLLCISLPIITILFS